MPNMKLATDAFLLEDIRLPEFYSVQFEIFMVEQDNYENKIILGFTNGDEGNREPSFSMAKKLGIFNTFNFVTKISSGDKHFHETTLRSEWWNKWLSFKIKFYFLISHISYKLYDISISDII